MRHFTHYNVAVLTSNSACAMEFAETLHKTVLLRNSKEAKNVNIRMTFYLCNEELLNLANISSILYEIKMHKTSIIILLSLKATECVIFHVANILKMASHDITWILLEHKVNSLSKNCLPFQVINIQRNVKLDSTALLLLNGFSNQVKTIMGPGFGSLSKSNHIKCT